MGAEEWRYADDLEGITKKRKRLYLNSTHGSANDAFHSGSLDEGPPGESQPDVYVYDPLDVRPADLEVEEIKNIFTDQRYALNLYGAGLVYHSLPFEEDTEITGFVKLVAWLELDVPDTDFWVRLSEIQPDGAHILLTEDFLRARYRTSLREEELVAPGEVNPYEFDGFRFFSRRIARGSRLRLVLRAPNSIFIQKNYNSGGVVAEESGKDALTAHVRLHHDAEHASYLELPVVGRFAKGVKYGVD
jgi:putative CocE/NonD family hydrolase